MAWLGRKWLLAGLLIGVAFLVVLQFSTLGKLAFRKGSRSRGQESTMSMLTTTNTNSYTREENTAEHNSGRFQGSVKDTAKAKKTENSKDKVVISSKDLRATVTAGASKHTELSEKSEIGSTLKPTIAKAATTKAKPPVENSAVKRGFTEGKSYCSLSFDYGEMCPPSYVEIGGKCDLTPDGFDCPDIRNKSTYSHRQGQLVTTRLLRVFDLVAKKHNINYWLTSGTLLGAARHKGNIPWDTDNDIDIPLQDYIKFVEVGVKDLPSDVFLQNSMSDPYLRPSDKKYAASISHPKVGIYRRSWNPRLRDGKSCYKYCIAHNCKWHDGLMIDVFVIDGSTNGIFPLKEMEFEGFRFPVPNNFKEQLTRSYGQDFMKVPQEKSKRVPVDFPDIFHSCKELGGTK